MRVGDYMEIYLSVDAKHKCDSKVSGQDRIHIIIDNCEVKNDYIYHYKMNQNERIDKLTNLVICFFIGFILFKGFIFLVVFLVASGGLFLHIYP